MLAIVPWITACSQQNVVALGLSFLGVRSNDLDAPIKLWGFVLRGGMAGPVGKSARFGLPVCNKLVQ